jgi:hypothetical protein
MNRRFCRCMSKVLICACAGQALAYGNVGMLPASIVNVITMSSTTVSTATANYVDGRGGWINMVSGKTYDGTPLVQRVSSGEPPRKGGPDYPTFIVRST